MEIIYFVSPFITPRIIPLCPTSPSQLC
jgi:hypothetical protein